MKLLIIQETDWLKRYPAQQHHLAEMMSLRGHEVRAIDYGLIWKTEKSRKLYSSRKVYKHISKIHENANITVIRPGFIRLPGLDYVSMMLSHRREIMRQVKEFRPDAIVGFGILNNYTSTRILKKTNIPFICYWIDVLHLLIPSKQFRKVGEWVEKATLSTSDMVITINDQLKDLVLNMGAPKNKTNVLRAGINLDQFTVHKQGNIIRESLNISRDDVVLFFMGFLYDFAGLKEVAVKIAESKNNSLKLLIVGEGDAYNDLDRIRKEYKIEDKIILVGKKEYKDIPAYIAAADICLLPAYAEEPIMQDIVPIKLYEYMAMGKPVIATRLPGVAREFGIGNGMVYVDNPDQVVQKALELVSSNSQEELGLKARKFAERNSWEEITNQFENLVEEVIKTKAYV